MTSLPRFAANCAIFITEEVRFAHITNNAFVEATLNTLAFSRSSLVVRSPGGQALSITPLLSRILSTNGLAKEGQTLSNPQGIQAKIDASDRRSTDLTKVTSISEFKPVESKTRD